MIRAFLAFNISEEVKKNLGALIETLQGQTRGVKWIEPKNFHVTLKFFGNIDETKMTESIAEVVGKNIRGLKPVLLSCVGIGVFPKWEYPKVIWAGLEGEALSLVELHKHLEADFEKLGFPKEERELKMHLTVGRVKNLAKNFSWPKTLQAFPKKSFGEVRVDHVTLYKSQLTKAGPIYTAVTRFNFKT